MQTRRKFIQIIPLAGATLLVGQAAFAQAKLDEKDPQAVALGYANDATKVDKTKQAKYVAGQSCAKCQLYQAGASADGGACPLFAGKVVSSKGWCSAFVAKT